MTNENKLKMDDYEYTEEEIKNTYPLGKNIEYIRNNQIHKDVVCSYGFGSITKKWFIWTLAGHWVYTDTII